MTGRWSRRHRNRDAEEMNITAFMNLMVVLVPFLLLTAVFSRLTILELNLPGGVSEASASTPTLELEVVVRADRIDVADRSTGVLGAFPLREGKHDLAAVREKLKAVKAEYPDLTAATVLLEADTPYDVMVQVMDTVRAYQAREQQRTFQAELFPDISLGDAPP